MHHFITPWKAGVLASLAAISSFAVWTDLAPASEPLHLNRNAALLVAFQNNRQLAIAELAVARANSTLRWAGRLDNPELELSLNDDGAGLNDDEGVFEVAFTQRFPVTSRLGNEKRLRSSQVLLADTEIAEQRRLLAGEVDLAVVDLMAANRLLATQRGMLEVSARIVTFLDEQVAQGTVSRLDAMQARLAGSALKQAIDRLETERQLQNLALKELLGVEPETAVTISETMHLPASPPDERLSIEFLATRRPDFLLASVRVDEADASLALEQSRRWEDVALRVFAERERAVDEPAGLERNTFLGAGLSIPLPLRQRNQAGIEKALIDREATEKSVAAARFQIRSEYERAFQRRLELWKLAREASGEVLELADENVAEFEEAQRTGQASLLQVQRALEQQLELRTAAQEGIAAYYRADAQVRFVSGDYPGLSPRDPALRSK